MSALNKNIPILRTENLHKWFGKVHALSDFNFDIYPGEAVSLIGDNGAGKSTFAKIISGVIPQTKGKIFWKNEELKNNSIEMARKIGIETVYQEQALVPALSVTKNIFLGRVITKYNIIKVLYPVKDHPDTSGLIFKLQYRIFKIVIWFHCSII